MKHYVVVFGPAWRFERARAVRADRVEARQGALRFYVGRRLVYQAPEAYVSRWTEHPHGGDAARLVREIRDRRHGAATFHVVERGVAPRRARTPSSDPSDSAVMIEGVSVSVREMG